MAVVEIGWLDWVAVFLYAVFLLPFERRSPGTAGVVEPSGIEPPTSALRTRRSPN